jgi:hypothetical protein
VSEIRPGFQRELNAVVDAFKAGLAFEPPVIAPSEFRAAMRMIGYPLHEDDENLAPPTFEFPDPHAVEDDDAPEEDA